MATTSAWRPGAGSVAPSKTSPSAVTTTAPTQGRGEVEARTAAALRIARRISASSSTSTLLVASGRAPRRLHALALIRTLTVGSGWSPSAKGALRTDRASPDDAGIGFAGFTAGWEFHPA